MWLIKESLFLFIKESDSFFKKYKNCLESSEAIGKALNIKKTPLTNLFTLSSESNKFFKSIVLWKINNTSFAFIWKSLKGYLLIQWPNKKNHLTI